MMGGRALIEGRKHAPEDLGRVLVLGLGKSGRAAIDYLVPLLGSRVRQLAVAAGKRSPEACAYAEQVRERGVRVEFDHEAIDGPYDLCIASPGISQFSAFYESAAAASGEVVSEVEFAWRESAADVRWVAVTGTNGKTTTVALVAHLLREAGMAAKAVGNIGDTCIEAVSAGDVRVFVAETSSYQLASTSLFAPDVAVMLNITPDHLSWHGSFEEYVNAKLKVLANLAGVPGSVAVLDATNDEVRKTVRALRVLGPEERGFAYVPVGTKAGIGGDMRAACGSDNAAYLADDGRLTVALNGCEHALLSADELRIKGEHNVSNALHAAAAALALGADERAVSCGLASFEPLEHRLEPCGVVAGAACYNDSKATNVDATLKAFAAFGDVRPIVLLGGRDKGTDLAPLVEAAREHAKAVVCFGESADRFASAFRPTQIADAAAFRGTQSRGDAGGSRSEVRVASAIPTISGTTKALADSLAPTCEDGFQPAASGQSPAPEPSSLTGVDLRFDKVQPEREFAVLRANHLEDALDVALSVAEEGDVVLLSPACASFDEFKSFEERGRVFKAFVADRAMRAGKRG